MAPTRRHFTFRRALLTRCRILARTPPPRWPPDAVASTSHYRIGSARRSCPVREAPFTTRPDSPDAPALRVLPVLTLALGTLLSRPPKPSARARRRDVRWPAAGTQRRRPIRLLALVLSWSPTHCATVNSGDSTRSAAAATAAATASCCMGCGRSTSAAIPNSARRRAGPFVPQHVIDGMLDIMPSPKLVIHEFRKHGACSGLDAIDYYALSRKLFARVKVPEAYANPFENRMVGPDDLMGEFLAANPGLKPDMLAVSCGGAGNRLREVRICFAATVISAPCGRNEDQRRLCSASACSCRRSARNRNRARATRRASRRPSTADRDRVSFQASAADFGWDLWTRPDPQHRVASGVLPGHQPLRTLMQVIRAIAADNYGWGMQGKTLGTDFGRRFQPMEVSLPRAPITPPPARGLTSSIPSEAGAPAAVGAIVQSKGRPIVRPAGSAIVWLALGFASGVAFWHFVGFWSFVSEVVFRSDRSPVLEARHPMPSRVMQRSAANCRPRSTVAFPPPTPPILQTARRCGSIAAADVPP